MELHLSLGLCEVRPKGTLARTAVTRNAQNFLLPLTYLKRQVVMLTVSPPGLFSLGSKEQDLNYHFSYKESNPRSLRSDQL